MKLLMKQNPKIIQITDTHLFAYNQTWYEFDTNKLLLDTLSYLKSFINKKSFLPDMFLLTGDLSQDGTKSSYQFLLYHLEKFNIKIAYVPGNHDNLSNLEEVFKKSSLVLKEKVVNLPNAWKLVLLNSVNVGKTAGYLSKDELLFLQSTLTQSKNTKIVVVLHHHPVLINHYMDKYILENFDEFQQIIFKFSSIKAVIFGHIHQQRYYKVNDVGFYGTPSTCMQLKTSSNTELNDRFSNEKPGFRTFEFNGDNIFSDVVRVLI